MTAATIFDDTACELGEGPLWHPERGQLFWFDILGKRLLARDGGGLRQWSFDEHVSAAGWIDRDRLLIASETRLFDFNLETGASETVCGLEADRPDTRSNDGRADPWGGFWIGTMGKSPQPGAGAIYRYYKGELRRLLAPISTPNSICFAPDRRCAYFTDTPTRRIMRLPLAKGDGWPEGAPELFVDLGAEGLNPDGSVTDAEGLVWNAQWGASRVAAYRPDGSLARSVAVPARHTSCPAFGGPDLTTLYVTTARENLGADVLASEPQNGMTFVAANVAKGLAEHRVAL